MPRCYIDVNMGKSNSPLSYILVDCQRNKMLCRPSKQAINDWLELSIFVMGSNRWLELRT